MEGEREREVMKEREREGGLEREKKTQSLFYDYCYLANIFIHFRIWSRL